jgi:Protein of unknown function, DUF547
MLTMQHIARRLACLAAAWALSACTTLVPPPASRSDAVTPQQAQAAWQRVLERFVNSRGEVDFEALSRDRADLDLIVRHVADQAWPQDDARAQLTARINAYNALSMFNVIDSGIPATHAGTAKLKFFVLKKFVIAGQPMSLYAFENNVIRPLSRSVGEPRIHFALNCSARACPVLPREAFVAARLDEQLARETRAFFARLENFCIDDAARSVWISELLDFYPEDFVPEHAPTLVDYAARNAGRTVPAGYKVRLTPYDWTIANSRQPAPPAATRCPG